MAANFPFMFDDLSLIITAEDEEVQARLAELDMQMNMLHARSEETATHVDRRLRGVHTELEYEIVKMEQKLAKFVDVSMKDLDKAMLQVAAKVKMVVVRSYAILSQVVATAGVTIDPILNALVHLAFTTWEQYLVMASAHSTSMNVVGAALAIASATISLGAAIQAQNEQRRMKAEMEAQRAEMSRAQSLGFSITFVSD